MENTYRTAMQTAFEELMINAGSRIGGSELVEIFDAASRTAGWYAEHENVLYRHPGQQVTRDLEGWRQYWHEMADGTRIPFRQWVCMNLERASRDELLFGLTESDVQIMAEDVAGRYLTDEEMARVRKGLNAGLDGWQPVMETAIREAVKERDPVDTRATGA